MTNVTVGVLSLYEVFAYFFLYSFLGWVAEVAFHAITAGKFVNRGFLNGPVCPIYGVGVVVILLILGPYVEKPWLVLLVGIALPTFIELVTGWALETFFHNKWWDYSSRKLNFKGYICLEFSILWGVAVLVVVDVVHPAVKWFAGLFGDIAGTVLVSVCLAALVADLVLTVLQVLNLNKRLKEIDDAAKAMRAGSELIGKGIAHATLAAEKEALKVKDSAKEAKERARDAIIKKCPKRLLKAFPYLASKRCPEALLLVRESMARAQLGKKRRKKGSEGAAKEVGEAIYGEIAPSENKKNQTTEK